MKDFWKGSYNQLDFSPTNKVKADSVSYKGVYSEEQLVPDSPSEKILLVLPLTWFSEDMKCFLYPTDEKLLGRGPVNWPNATFARHFFPKSSWEKFDVQSIAFGVASK